MILENVSAADIDQLVGAYREAAMRHGEATENGDHEEANRSAEIVLSVYSELRRRGPAAQIRLLSFLADEAPGVRLWAASHALDFSPAEGARTLQELVSSERLIGLSAKTTLREWREGKLRFP